MRLRQHLTNESMNFKSGEIPDAVLKMIYDDCQPYLKDCYKSDGTLLYRGVSKSRGSGFTDKPRDDRKPFDSSQIWHDLLDNAFKDKFGVKARSEGLFCKIAHPTGYGIDYIIFPVGKYSLIWNPNVMDAYFMDMEDSDPELRKKSAENMVKGYQQTNIYDASKSLTGTKKRVEIACMCKKYHAISSTPRNIELIQDWIHNTHAIK